MIFMYNKLLLQTSIIMGHFKLKLIQTSSKPLSSDKFTRGKALF